MFSVIGASTLLCMPQSLKAYAVAGDPLPWSRWSRRLHVLAWQRPVSASATARCYLLSSSLIFRLPLVASYCHAFRRRDQRVIGEDIIPTSVSSSLIIPSCRVMLLCSKADGCRPRSAAVVLCSLFSFIRRLARPVAALVAIVIEECLGRRLLLFLLFHSPRQSSPSCCSL